MTDDCLALSSGGSHMVMTKMYLHVSVNEIQYKTYISNYLPISTCSNNKFNYKQKSLNHPFMIFLYSDINV